MEKRGGFSYCVSKDKVEEFQKLTYEQRLDWVRQMNQFLQNFMPKESKIICEKLRKGEILKN